MSTETTATAPQVSYGFDDSFEQELEVAAQSSGEGRAKAAFKAMPGFKTTYAKAGTFTQKRPNPKDPKKDLTVTTDAIRGIILDASFNREYWATVEENGKKTNKLLCQTVAHKTKADMAEGAEEGQRSGNGKWQIPYFGDLAIQKYDPMGSRGKSCAECIAAGEHGKAPGSLTGEGGCGAKGSIIVLQLAMDAGVDQMTGEAKGMQPIKPSLANLQTPEVSGIEFQKYVVGLNKEGFRPNTVVTNFGLQPTRNGKSNMLKLAKAQPADPKVAAEGMEMYKAEIERIEAERKARAEEFKKKQQEKNGNAAPEAATAVDEMGVGEDEFQL